MKLHIVARGKLGTGPEAALVDRYMRRIRWDVQQSELPETGGKVAAVIAPAVIIALDERGANWTSVQLATHLQDWRDAGVREARFLIGAADGLSREERASADQLLSFGKATWPHLLVRVMLAEQLYRASAILANHPYHRAG
jgi:23S rRNA (pseudouridine1915-N3)-methyltransferase